MDNEAVPRFGTFTPKIAEAAPVDPLKKLNVNHQTYYSNMPTAKSGKSFYTASRKEFD